MTKRREDDHLSENSNEELKSRNEYPDERQKITRRLIYFRKRYGLHKSEMIQFSHQYRHILQIRILIEKAFDEFIRTARLRGIKSTEFQGTAFLHKIQQHIIHIYRNTKMGELLPNGYPIIM
ncbi:MAG: hypothetical protein J6O88_18920 [Chryseobacterium sp.]|uniref:hypothetical protein n=1 Tax=Chryseobacterium sp. TaxID=1871047 RepID=UPI001B06AC6A|nr:hypothetical protein [Chryseobacterium sp.]MBO6186729.1 hypothetical protein [Chryseobacterium sp.]